MNSDKIKEIWKDNAVKQIDAYSALQIERIILRNARKAMGLSLPGAGYIAMLIVALLYCIWGMIWGAPQMRVFFTIVVAFSILVVIIVFYQRLRMQHYAYNKPLKEWIGSRINELDKSLHQKRLATVLRRIIGLLFPLFYCVILRFTAGFPMWKIIIVLTVGVITLIIFDVIWRRRTVPRMIESRKRLQELYDQLEN